MVKVSVVLGSSRPGGLDVSFRGLADQTYEDFEIIFTDGRYHKRHAQVLDMVKEYGIKQPFYHVPNHRYNGIWSVNCAGANTGFMLSEGEIVIMLLDYAYTPAGWIEEHLKYHDKPRLVMSPHVYLEMPELVTKNGEPPIVFAGRAPWVGSNFDNDDYVTTMDNILEQKENFDELHIFKEGKFDRSWLERAVLAPQEPKVNIPTGPLGWEWMHTKNDSFPLKTCLDIGGIDENFDRGRGPGDLEFGFRLILGGCDGWHTQEARVFCYNPRKILSNVNLMVPDSWGGVTRTLPRWDHYEGEAYGHERMNLMAAGMIPVKANNPYDMYKRRMEIWHWRELSQERETLIKRNDVPNEMWYK